MALTFQRAAALAPLALPAACALPAGSVLLVDKQPVSVIAQASTPIPEEWDGRFVLAGGSGASRLGGEAARAHPFPTALRDIGAG